MEANILRMIGKAVKDEKGASSVLVVMILLVLVILGLAALTTSLSAMRLGEKSGSWYKNYYRLDALAEKNIAIIDNAMDQASQFTDHYMTTSDNKVVYTDLIKNNPKEEEKILFLYYLNEELEECGIVFSENELSESELTTKNISEYLPGLGFDVIDGEIENMKLEVKIEIIYEKDDVRFKIIKWVEKNSDI